LTFALDHTESRPRLAVSSVTGWTGVAGMASLGAGAIHASAIGVHAEHRQAALTFTIVAALQLAWGGLALLRSGRLVTVLGGLIGLGAIAGWIVAKSQGIGFVDGMEQAESVQLADGLAALLAAVSVVLVAVALATERGSSPLRRPMTLGAVAVTALAFAGMVAGGTHAHAAGDGHGTAGHGGSDDPVAAADHHDDDQHASGEQHAEGEDHVAPAVAPVPYDPTKPIDLGGVDGVTLEQQAMAENIVAVTVMRLGQWADPAVAEAAGFRSIGDGGTGHEHFVHAEFRADGIFFDPDRPESLVYDTTSGERRLVAAMYMVDEGTPLEEVPDYGGALMQWHVHDNLCYNAEGQVRGLTDEAGNCAAGLTKPVPTPMIHVWIEPHPCGPFAALEGIAGGTVPEGEEVLCDHAHGA
jgi:hypothetical protein